MLYSGWAYYLAHLEVLKEKTMIVPMAIAAKELGATKQTLAYYISAGKITSRRAGRIVLVDTETAKEELEKYGYYRRTAQREQRKNSTV